MVALDNAAHFDTAARPRFSIPLAVACAVLAVAVGGLALRGFGDNGARFATQLAWRFECVVFFAALVVGPLGRMIAPLQVLADKGRPLLQGFCAGMAVYFAAILLPNLLAVPDGVRQQGITAGMTFFVFFTGSVVLVMATALNRSLCQRVGSRACRAMLAIAAIYFWACYSLIGLAHMAGPHRPDHFYEVSVILMVTALFVRFFEHFTQSWRQDAPAP